MTFYWGQDHVMVVKPCDHIDWCESDKYKVKSKVVTYEIPRLIRSEVIKTMDAPCEQWVRLTYHYENKKHVTQCLVEEKFLLDAYDTETIIFQVAKQLAEMMTTYLDLNSDVSNALQSRLIGLGIQTQFMYTQPEPLYLGQSISFHSEQANAATGVSRDSQYLPGVETVVRHPATGDENKLWNIIQDLNDHHKWSREKIADWIDELHDKGTIDASFGSEKIEVGPSKYKFSMGWTLPKGGIVPLPVSFGVSGNSIDNKENNEDKE